jgi:hypothetical protein
MRSLILPGVYGILENTDVIWGKKYGKGKRKRGKMSKKKELWGKKKEERGKKMRKGQVKGENKCKIEKN